MCSMVTCTGTMNQWLEPMLSKKCNEIQMKKGKARSQRALCHEKDLLTSSSRQWGDTKQFQIEVLYSYLHFKKTCSANCEERWKKMQLEVENKMLLSVIWEYVMRFY